MRNLIVLSLYWLFLVSPSMANNATLHRQMEVKLFPQSRSISVVDRITLPENHPPNIEFSLLASLQPSVSGGKLVPLPKTGNPLYRRFRFDSTADQRTLEISYQGKIQLPTTRGQHQMPVAVLDSEGVFLDGASGWYAWFGDLPMTFELSVTAPADWEVITQGKRVKADGNWHFHAMTPQDDIYLLAGHFKRYSKQHGNQELAVYLLETDDHLANTYLTRTASYIDLYSHLIGEYPYPGFAVIENRWQTGYGMPSFTLLGSRVLRLPFIPYTSLPHEVLHNWWGNGVWIDYAGGNWSEGLTAYLADHLLKEQKTEDIEYRRKTLERYTDYASSGKDFPLLQFTARHNETSQAVGYGKSLMWFHMLRRELGEAGFRSALQQFWKEWRFRNAGFRDVLDVFRQHTDTDLSHYEQWLNNAGAPAIHLQHVALEREDGAYRLSLDILQAQNNVPFRFPLTIAISFAEPRGLEIFRVEVRNRLESFSWSFDEQPLRLDIDPYFDTIRRLHPAERPATLSRLFGANSQLVVLPSDASEAENKAWKQLIDHWSDRYGNLRWSYDKDLTALPEDEALWVMGWNNRWLSTVSRRLNTQKQKIADDSIQIGDRKYDSMQHAAVLLDPDNSRPPMGWIGAGNPQIIPRLASKLTHYGSFGRLVFDNKSATNIVRETLPLTQSPLSVSFIPDTHLQLPKRPGLLTVNANQSP